MSTSTGTTSKSSPSSATTNPIGRTLLFAGAAVACLAVTAGIEYASHPDPIKEFGRIGEQFYPEFEDPTLASSLEVYAFDTEDVVPQEFIVKRMENGRWSIPSRHDYPADAEDQLAKTAASVIGIERGAMVTRWPADHAGYGVVNPKQESLKVDEVEGVGKRLILRGDDNAVLVDYIIGEQPESEQSDEYYVRHPEEDEVYIASLSIDLSTNFSDWIDTDLLHINQTDMVQLTINDYAFDELQGTITKAETSVLKRAKSYDPWVLDGLNEETEEVDKDAMRDAANAIADMKIVGVRPKQPGLTPDLKLDRTTLRSQNDFERMQTDLLTQGFILQQDAEPDTLKLIAREGELYAATEDGLNYRMHFGRAFTGSLEELEVDLNSDGEAADKDSESDDDAAEEAGDNDDESDADSDDDKNQTGRYVFVRVEFDEVNLGERPTEPLAPEMPEELKQAADDADEAAADDAGDAASEDADDEKGEESEEDDPLAEIRETYESAQKEYEEDLKKYNEDLESLEKKIEDGTKKAEEMNRRFAEWYYVVPGETFDKLRLSRKDIVKDKEKSEDSDTDSLDAADPTTDEPAADEPAADEPAADEPAADEPAADEPAADEPAADEPAADEPAADEPAADEPAADEPAADEPAADEPAADEPAADEPAADEPAADEPAADEPAADEPAADEPAADESTESPQEASAEEESIEEPK